MAKAIAIGGVNTLNLISLLFENGRSRGVHRIDPAPDLVLEMLGSSHHWNMAADMADAFGGGCLAACEDRPGLWDSRWSY